MKKKKDLVKLLLGVAIFALVAAGLFAAYQKFGPQNGNKGDKKVIIEVVIPEQDSTEHTLHTNATTLREALDEEKLIGGNESDYGFWITTVANRVADDSKQEWWCITKAGEQVNYGVDDITIEDGERYELTLMVGY